MIKLNQGMIKISLQIPTAETPTLLGTVFAEHQADSSLKFLVIYMTSHGLGSVLYYSYKSQDNLYLTDEKTKLELK